MRIEGTSFSDTPVAFKSDITNYELVMNWSRDAIDIIKAQPHETNSDLRVIITLTPNSINCGGEDDVIVQVWRMSRNGRPEQNMVMMSEHHSNILRCLDDLNKRLAEIKERNDNPDIIVRDGKKYRLVEVK